MREPPFAKHISEREAQLGKTFAEQLHRAMLTEEQARQWADTEAHRRTQAMLDERPFPSRDDREVFQHLRACETRTQQARFELNRHCRAIGARLDIKHFALIHDWFRQIAGPVTPIRYDDVDPITVIPKPKPPSNRRNRWCTEHDEHIRQSDIRYLMQRDGLNWHEASQAYPEKIAEWPKPPAPPATAYLPAAYLPLEDGHRKQIEAPALTGPQPDQSSFTFYDWTNYPPDGIGERCFQQLQASEPHRHDITRRKRQDDAERQRRNVQDATAEIAAHKLAITTAATDEDRQQAQLRLSATIRKLNLAKGWLSRPETDREPAGRNTYHQSGPGHLIRAEAASRANASRIKAFLQKGQRLPQAPSNHVAYARMSDRYYCGSHAHRLQVENSGCIWNYDPEHNRTEPTKAALFEIRFRHHLMDRFAIPVYAATVWGSSLEIVHARFFDRLHPFDFDLIAQEGLHLADRLEIDVQWGGKASPAQWEIEE